MENHKGIEGESDFIGASARVRNKSFISLMDAFSLGTSMVAGGLLVGIGLGLASNPLTVVPGVFFSTLGGSLLGISTMTAARHLSNF